MNPGLQAVTQALVDAVAGNRVIPSPAAATEKTPSFTLPQITADALAQRLQGAKNAHLQATATQQENDPAAMQALMALLLSQSAPQALAKVPDGEGVNVLATVQAGGTPAPRLSQLMAVKEPSPEQVKSLQPQLQQALATLTAEPAQTQGTPQQQATLAHYAAQDLRIIAPQQPVTTARQAPQRPAPAPRDTAPRPLAVKKTDNVKVSSPVAAQTLLAMTTAEQQPVNDRHVIAAHASLPTMVSGDELGEKLTALLKDRIQFQLNQQQQISTIRLDPPTLGKLEIAVQLDNGKLMVHIGANQSEVCRALQQFSENLRQHLTAQNFMEVNVQVSSEGQSQQQQQPGHQDDEVMSALTLNDEPHVQQYESILLKV